MRRSPWIRLAVVASLSACAYAAGAAPTARPTPMSEPDIPAVRRAGRLEVQDAKGKTRAQLRLTPEGAAQLRLLDRGGKERVLFQVTETDVPQLMMRNAAGAARAEVALAADGTPCVKLNDLQGKEVLALRAGEEGGLYITDGAGTRRVAFRTGKDGAPRLTLHNTQGGDAAEASLDGSGKPCLLLIEKGLPVWRAPK